MKLFREPLVHFLILGAVLFILFEALGKSASAPPPAPAGAPGSASIEVTPELIENLKLSAQRMGAAAEGDAQQLIDNYVREEVLVREAIARQLDRDDTQIRRRLVQKMEFASPDSLAIGAPAYETLKSKYSVHVTAPGAK